MFAGAAPARQDQLDRDVLRVGVLQAGTVKISRRFGPKDSIRAIPWQKWSGAWSIRYAIRPPPELLAQLRAPLQWFGLGQREVTASLRPAILVNLIYEEVN